VQSHWHVPNLLDLRVYYKYATGEHFDEIHFYSQINDSN